MKDVTDKSSKAIFQPDHVMGLSVPLWVFDIDESHVLWANDAALALWKAKDRDELFARDMSADMSASIEQRLKQYQNEFLSNGRTFNELWTLYPNGQPHTYRVCLHPHPLPDGRMAMLCEAHTEEQQLPERLRSSEALNHIPVCISLISKDAQTLYANAAAHMTYGSSTRPVDERFARREDLDLLTDELENYGFSSMICQVNTIQGLRWHEISARSCFDAATGISAYTLSEVDVTELKEQEQKVRYLAHHDTLTGLHNRNYVHLAFPDILSEAARNHAKLAMLLIDLDKFKAVNDTLGHASGDRLLMHVGRSLDQLTKGSGQIARLGGDEFILLLPFVEKDELSNLCEQILANIARDCMIGEHRISSEASIGISLFPEHGTDLSSLLKHADLALYDSKDAGRNTYSYFRPALQQALLQQRSLEKDLVLAIQRQEFRMFYQPRVDCQTQQVLSVEALMRWFHPERGVISPGLFISTLEETGLIHEVGEWMVEQVGHDQRAMAAEGFDIPISINISPRQFERPDFPSMLEGALAKTGCPSSCIELEITESMLMGEGFDAKQMLNQLNERGFSIAIDDFGTGYSNLAYIQDYPISVLKVDRSFIQMIEDQSSVVNLILSLCRLIGISAVAEGVETVDQLAWLQLNHCDQFQGYLHSRPTPFASLMDLLANPPRLAQGEETVDFIHPEVEWA